VRDYILFGTGALCAALYMVHQPVLSVVIAMLLGIATNMGRI